ncbi:insulinase family protein [Flavobacterium selenitireducens]|uniref:insulinase family protein n=1 Tax=Flavobacterium selenitireducens TaxID=2722704 RepID=UPI00168A92F0|nr:insulinase family protein [Flavobacterium selenitireducens]MBD3582309.1 insulinase family protein [Flavobacterium selenitireducens]
MQAQDRPQPKPGPAPVINVKAPETFKLPNGLKVLVVENHKLPRVSYNLTLDNAPYAEGNKKGVADLTSELIGKGSRKITKDAFNEEVDFLGADISFSANGAYASSLSKYGNRVLELMAEGALSPNFTQEEFDKEKTQLIEGLKTQEKSVPAVAGRVRGVLAYGKTHPSGEYLTEETINNVTLQDVKQNYYTYFVPGNAYLVVIGDVKPADVKKQVTKLFGNWKSQKAPNVSYTDPKNVQYTQINFVDMPNAVQSEISLINTVRLEMKDPDFFPAILANQVLGGDFNSYLNMNLREAHGWTYGARSGISGSRYVTTFSASSQVRNAVTDSAVVEFMKEIKRIRTEKVSKEVLDAVKAGYIGRFVMQVDKPQTIARYALNIETEGLPADFYKNYIKSIEAVTPEDIQRVANKYFLAENQRIIIVGKGSDVLPSLEKFSATTKIPIVFFDKFGNQVAKPEAKKTVATGVTAKSVLENYVKAIGGEKAIAGIKTTSATFEGNVQGTPLVLTMKNASTGKSSVNMNAMGMTVMKQVTNDKGAYMEQQGQRKDFTGEELADRKESARPFKELQWIKKSDVTLAGIETINGTDAYAIKSGKSTVYFDTKTGLKVAESKASDQGVQTMNFGDYKEVKGVKFPHKMTVVQPQMEIEFTATDVKVNEGVTDADFQ